MYLSELGLFDRENKFHWKREIEAIEKDISKK